MFELQKNSIGTKMWHLSSRNNFLVRKSDVGSSETFFYNFNNDVYPNQYWRVLQETAPSLDVNKVVDNHSQVTNSWGLVEYKLSNMCHSNKTSI